MKLSKTLALSSLVLGSLIGCGQATQDSSLTVSNGQDIDESEYPAVVMLYDAAKGALCTATFVTDDTVLTAAHCTMGGEVVDKKTGKVDHSIQLVRMLDPKTRKVKVLAESVEIYRHPKWDEAFKTKQVNEYDIGTIKFPTGTAKAVAEIGDTPSRGDEITIVGYGLNYVPRNQNDIDPSSVGVKRKGTNDVSMLNGGFIYFFGNTKTTDGDGTNVNAAPGDSGGPMFNEAGQLVGVTSGGGRLLGRGVSLYIDLKSEMSKNFLNSRGLNL
ncbi:MAG: hypothetical protein CMP10_17845 [Zetaproteobacteria bacterium]|nr:hypothetical protein [Pseudobdellovibrionaceae bacterium]